MRKLSMMTVLAISNLAMWAQVAVAADPVTAVVDTGTPTSDILGPMVIYNDGYGSYQDAAGYFTLASRTVISSIEVFIASESTRNEIYVSLFEDGPTPGSRIFFTSFARHAGEGWRDVAISSQILDAGSYWVGFSAQINQYGDSSYNSLQRGPPAPLARYAFQNEFTGGWLISSGPGFGLRVLGTVVGVPEPASWALMIVGMAFVGGAMRRRHDLAMRFA